MTFDKKDVEEALLRKGFKMSNSDHHYITYWSLAGKKTRSATKTSHTPKEKSLDMARINQMAKQCFLSKTQFIDLIKCPLNREDYEVILQQKGHV